MTTLNLGIDRPVLGGDDGAWDDKINDAIDKIDGAFDITTPTLTDASGAGLTLIINAVKSGKVGPHLAFIAFNISWPSNSSGAVVVLAGNPLPPAAGMYMAALCHSSATTYVNAPIFARAVPGGNTIEIFNGQTNVQVTNLQLSTGFARACIVYPI